MSLTPQEQALLQALEQEFEPKQPSRSLAAPTRAPGDLNTPNIQVISPEEEALMVALEQEFGPRQFQAPGPVEQKGLLTQIGDKIDSYTGAPVRQAIGTFQDTNSLNQAGSALIDSFGADPALAPTGKEIATKAGFSPDSLLSFNVPIEGAQGRIVTKPGTNEPMMKQEVSPAGVVGFGIDMGADLTNLLPFAGVTLKGSAKTGRAFLKGSAKAARVADEFTGVPLVKAGEVLEATGKAGAETVAKTKRALIKAFKPDVADDYNEISRIAAENDIPQDLLNEAHKYGENSVVSRYARNNAEGPLGGLEKHEALTQAVSEATENKIRKFSNVESIPDDIEAGSALREAYDEGVDNFFKGMGETYNSAIQFAKKSGIDLRLDKKSATELSRKLNEMEQWALGRLGSTKDFEKVIDGGKATRGQVNKATKGMLEVLGSTNKAITKGQASQAKEVLNAVRLARNAITTSGGDMAQIYSAMRDVGEVAFKTKNSLAEIPSDVRKFQELYFSLQKAGTESIRTGLGDDFADALIKNNSDMSNFFTKRGDIVGIIGNKSLSDEKVFQSLIMNGDSKKIDALQSIVSPEAFNKLRATFLYRVINPAADGAINFKKARADLNKLKKSGKLKLMMSDPEIVELDEVLRLGERGGIGVLSTSGTGAASKFSDLSGTIKDHLAGETIVNNIKNSTRSNYVEVPAKTADGKAYVELIRKPKETKKSGIARLRERNPITKTQAARGAQLNSIQERNERLERYKAIRGL